MVLLFSCRQCVVPVVSSPYKSLGGKTKKSDGDVESAGGASPIDKAYLKKLHNAQRNIRDAYELIENSFKDYRTAYLLTSAHGLSILGEY